MPVVGDELLALLRCPLSMQPLALAPSEICVKLGLEAGLLRQDGAVLYPIRDGIPILTPEAGIPVPGNVGRAA